MTEETEHVYEDGFVKIPGMTVLPWAVWLALLVMVILALWAGKVFAEPIVMASNGKVTITVYSEPCAFPDHVTNLPIRATWNEGGKVIEGCAGRDAENGIAVFWFSDKTVFTLSLSAFVKVTGV